MKVIVKIILAGALCAAAWHAGAQVYKVTGPDGRVSYSDKAPRDGKQPGKVTSLSFANYPTVTPVRVEPTAKGKSVLAAEARAEDASRSADQSAALIMFSTANCKYCALAKRHLGGKGIAYADLDIDRDALAAQEFKKLGGRGVPLFAYKGRTMSGYSEQGLNEFLKL